ncbi:MAG TPA: PEP-CTERM sorting domain-containing protein [Lacipirellulaceae bacterium]|jgi:hypothetical protein|nr:PEP-CTERM sorting domain-containing protein [Lacipirellulaceae bacterium]
MSISFRIAAAGILALLVASDGRSELVTFRFEGTVIDVLIDIPDFWGTPNVDWPDIGASFSGFYTFDSTATDTAMSPEQGSYHTVLENATAVDVRVGELNLQGAATYVVTFSSIYGAGDWIPSLELVSHPEDADIFTRNNFQLSIRKDGLLPGPILPLTPPPLDGAEYAVLRLGLDSGYNTRPWPYVWIEATLDSLELAPQTPGDFNANGIVDAADYLIWRASDGSQEGYDIWRANFGRTDKGTTSSSGLNSVPEPSTFFLLATACAMGRRKRCSQ